jgi:hypothetical protein
MAVFTRYKEKPAWLDQTREFCRNAGITIAAWGPRNVVVEANSAERAEEISTQLANFGFKPVPSEEDAFAGLLTLSHSD